MIYCLDVKQLWKGEKHKMSAWIVDEYKVANKKKQNK